MIPSSQIGALPKLLLITDCAVYHDTYRVALDREFVIISATRADGFRRATECHPDAIVLDVAMPGLSGWETCARLKSEDATADIPVLLLTSGGDADLSAHAVAVGASALLKKPCSAEKLKNAVVAGIASSAVNPQPARRQRVRRS